MNEYINLTQDNIDQEHLCCAISDKKHETGVNLKKLWLKDRIKEGHIFRKLNAQGKVFIEYAPLETAWVPVSGPDFTYIYCLWVSGSYKDKGYAKELLQYAVDDSKKQGKNGLCIISSKKKKPFLSEKSFFERHGFQVVDTVGDHELLALCFNDHKPTFNESVRKMAIADKELTIYYSLQCPFANNCIEEIMAYGKEKAMNINFIKVDTLEKAKNLPCVFNNWAIFKDGKFVSNTLLNKNSVAKLYQ